jgi:hypothetical protein
MQARRAVPGLGAEAEGGCDYVSLVNHDLDLLDLMEKVKSPK